MSRSCASCLFALVSLVSVCLPFVHACIVWCCHQSEAVMIDLQDPKPVLVQPTADEPAMIDLSDDSPPGIWYPPCERLHQEALVQEVQVQEYIHQIVQQISASYAPNHSSTSCPGHCSIILWICMCRILSVSLLCCLECSEWCVLLSHPLPGSVPSAGPSTGLVGSAGPSAGSGASPVPSTSSKGSAVPTAGSLESPRLGPRRASQTGQPLPTARWRLPLSNRALRPCQVWACRAGIFPWQVASLSIPKGQSLSIAGVGTRTIASLDSVRRTFRLACVLQRGRASVPCHWMAF